MLRTVAFLLACVLSASAFAVRPLVHLDDRYGSYDHPDVWTRKGHVLDYPTVDLRIVEGKNRKPVTVPVTLQLRWPTRIGDEANFYWDCDKGEDSGHYFPRIPAGEIRFESPFYVIPTTGTRPLCLKLYQPDSGVMTIELVHLRKGNNQVTVRLPGTVAPAEERPAREPPPPARPIPAPPPVAALPPLPGPRGNLDGWWLFRFGMREREVRDAVDANRAKLLEHRYWDSGGVTLVVEMYGRRWHGALAWDGTYHKDALSYIQLTTLEPDVSTPEAFHSLNAFILGKLGTKYGRPDFSSQEKDYTYDGGCTWNLLKYRWDFDNATITLNSVWEGKGPDRENWRMCSHSYSANLEYVASPPESPEF